MSKPIEELQQNRTQTNYLVGKISAMLKYTNEVCSGCNGTGLAKKILGSQDMCVLCFGEGKKVKHE